MDRTPQTLQLDFNNMLVERLGHGHGITPEEIESLRDLSTRVLQRLKEERARGLHPFLDLPHQRGEEDRILEVAGGLREWVEDFVVLGIGGSALGNIALHTALNPPYYNELSEERRGFPRVHVVDTIDPQFFSSLLKLINIEKTAFNVISKSGATVETMAQFLIVRDLLKKRLGNNHSKHIIATTGPQDGPLRRVAQQEGYVTFDVPEGVGGRYSVLTPVGLFSAAVSGVHINGLLSGAAHMDRRCQSENLWENPATMGAVLQYISYKKGKHIAVIMPYGSGLEGVAEWFCQLWAESLGKRLSLEGKVVHCGPTPVRALGPTDQHSQLQLYMEGPFDKVITFLALGRFDPALSIPQEVPDEDLRYLSGHCLGGLMEAERRGTEIALTEGGRPNYTIYLPELSAFHIGQLLYLFELQTVLTGSLLGVDPFDQPGVEAGKINTCAILGRRGLEAKKMALEACLRTQDKRYII